MRFLLDNNLPPSLCRRLSRLGHESFHVRKWSLEKAVDEIVLSKAESSRCVLLTHDLGFGKLMAFSGKRLPSIVIFRLEKLNAAILSGLLVKNWPLIEKPLLEGAIIVIEENHVRIRRLPIGRLNEEGFSSLHEPRAAYRVGKLKRRRKKSQKKK